MKRLLTSPPLLILVLIVIVGISVRADWGQRNWFWFQRSGSVIALIGAILGFRSIVRTGKSGVGGANTTILSGRVESVDDSHPVQRLQVSYDDSTTQHLRQADLDKTAGYFGAILVVIGTLVWGYGDLVGSLLEKT